MVQIEMVQVILVSVKKQINNYLFEALELPAHEVNEVLYIAGKALQDLVREELTLGNIDEVLDNLLGDGFLDLFRTSFAMKFRKKLVAYFAEQSTIEKSKIELIILIVFHYFLAELSKQLKEKLHDKGTAQLLSLAGIDL